MSAVDVSAAFTREASRIGDIAAGSDKAVSRAAGTLARRLPVQARRDIQTEYNLKAGRIKDGLSVTRGSGFVELRASKRPIGLIEFAGKWGRRKSPGAVAKVYRAQPRHNYGGTFIANLRGGNRQIVARIGKGRLPLKVLYGPSIANMLRNTDRKDRLATYAEDILASEFERLNGGAR